MKNYFLLALLLLVSSLSAQIVNIPDANFKYKLIALGIDTNSDGEIQNTEAEAVTVLHVGGFQITDLTGIQSFVNLDTLDCSSNLLTTLDVSNLTNLVYLDCRVNTLVSVYVNNCVSLNTLICKYNQIINLDVSTCINLSNLSCEFNQITSLDVNNCSNLQLLRCNNNQLNSLFIKNGHIEPYLYFMPNPTLQYVCADLNQILSVKAYIIPYGLTNVSVNSFCAYTPGGIYNTVSGKSIYDGDANGCTILDSLHTFLMIQMVNVIFPIDTGNVFTSQEGNYVAYLESGSYGFIPTLESPTYFSVSPILPNFYFPNDSNNVETQDFCIVPNGIFADVEIVLSPLNDARPGFNAEYLLTFHNKGTTTVSGDITVDFMGNKMTFVSASQATSSQTSNQLTWAYSNLQPFESRNITFTLNLLPPPTNNVGDVLNFSASIPLANDADGYDNYFTFAQNVVGSYDPNDKTCLEGHLLNNDKIGDYLHYLIRFQNTGNYPADHVVVVDSINVNQFDIASLQILETSHNAHINVNQGVLQFYFEDIQLADSFSNEPASHGYALFKIKTKANLPQNSSVANKAEIYFDYNLPVVTNTEITTFANKVGIFSPIQKPHFQLYPNPAQNSLTIETEKPVDFVILNVMGEMLISKHIEGKQVLDISMLPKGIYFLQAKNTPLGQSFIRE